MSPKRTGGNKKHQRIKRVLPDIKKLRDDGRIREMTLNHFKVKGSSEILPIVHDEVQHCGRQSSVPEEVLK